MSKKHNKRNKAKARKSGGGMSPYARQGKRPCQHCQQITAQDRRAAAQGQDIVVAGVHL
jgi:hypothetical protein